VPIELGYRGRPVGEGRIDLIVERRMVVELKAVEKLLPLREEQVLSYLKVTDHRIGLLINFNVEVLRHGVRRIVHHFVE
jgi:GxxExxY protein